MDYGLTIEEIYGKYKTSIEGLSQDEARQRLKEKGLNELKVKKGDSLVKIIFNQFKNFLVWLLILCAIISFFINRDEAIDSFLIVIVVIINTTLGVIEELHARNTLRKINSLETAEVIVKRDGKYQNIDAKEIVPGDIVRLEAGFLVPADIRIISSYNLYALESPLTGEEKAVLKDSLVISQKSELHEQKNIVFKGTFICEGRADGVVLKTGNETEIGSILNKVVETKSEKTPLEASLDKVSKMIGIIIIGICLVVYALELFITKNMLEAFSIAVSLSVAAIPEGLQSVLTTVMAISVLKMSKNKAIVKRMPVAQALGAINVIACDKTGTITTGNLEISKYKAVNNDVNKLKEALSLASADSSNQINKLLYMKHEEPYDMVPFNSKNKYEILIYKHNDAFEAYIKGAFDVIYQYANEKNKDLYEEAIKLTKNKERVLFVGKKVGKKNMASPDGLSLIGLVSFKDEIRDGVKDAITEAKALGVKPIMITGDFKETAFKIASEVGIAQDINEVLSHEELKKMDDEKLEKVVKNYQVYARVLPLDKLRIIDAYLKNKNTIAYVGDGINDAPALKKASVGISVSSGLDIAKDASDMILLDDSFNTISNAIREGRKNFFNIRKAIRYLLSSNIGEVTVVFMVAILSIKYTNLGVCLTPLELLWINLVTDTLPAISLGIDNNEGNYPYIDLIDKKLVKTILIEGIIIGLLSLLSFMIGYKLQDGSCKAMCFLTISFCQIFFSLSLHDGKKKNKYLILSAIMGITLTILATTALRDWFNIPNLKLINYVIALLLSLVFPLWVKLKNNWSK